MGVLLTSSELPELLTLSDRIIVLAEGRMTAEFSRAEATEHRILEAATASFSSEKPRVALLPGSPERERRDQRGGNGLGSRGSAP
jgi:ABC-type multidrug transport system ATPase subunit